MPTAGIVPRSKVTQSPIFSASLAWVAAIEGSGAPVASIKDVSGKSVARAFVWFGLESEHLGDDTATLRVTIVGHTVPDFQRVWYVVLHGVAL
jgi:hypothetical protein